MTDKNKQRMVEMLKAAQPTNTPGHHVLMVEHKVPWYLGHAEARLMAEYVEAEIDLQSSASAAAALGMAAEELHRNGLHGSCVLVQDLITPAGTSALASMLEEAERRGADRALKKYLPHMTHLDRCQYRRGHDCDCGLEDIRALKSGSAANG